MTMSKVYNLTWYGQRTPHLCSFSFSTGEDHQQICFQSLLFDLASLDNGVIVKIKNNTEHLWEYDRTDSSIPKTCVKNAKRLSVAIYLSTTYPEPVSKEYLVVQITAEAIDYTITYIIIGVICGIFACVFIPCVTFICCINSNCTDCSCKDSICDAIGSCCKFLFTCALCRLMKKDKVECDCNINDCCDSIRSRGNGRTTYTNSQHQEREITNNTLSGDFLQMTNGIDTIQVRLSDGEPRATSSASVFDPHKASDMRHPPPSYDDVLGKTGKITLASSSSSTTEV